MRDASRIDPEQSATLAIPSGRAAEIRQGIVFQLAAIAALKGRSNNFTLRAITASEHVQRKERLLNHCIVLLPALSLTESDAAIRYRAVRRSWRQGDGAAKLLRQAFHFAGQWPLLTGVALKRLLRDPLGRRQFRIINHMEQIPDRECRVDLSEARDTLGIRRLRIHWRIHPMEKSGLCRLHELLGANLKRYGTGTLESKLHPQMPDWPVSRSSSHFMGTTRMHDDPLRGVVDGNCRVHSVQNLFVAGSSVFPTSGYANPTLTIVALSIRLADHLKSLIGQRV